MVPQTRKVHKELQMSNVIDPLALPAGFDAASGGGSAFQFFKMKKADDEQVFRILPSFKGLAKKRDYSVFNSQHFGLVGRNPTDPGKKTFRPFLCIEEKRQGMIIKECPMCVLRQEYQSKFNSLKADEDKEVERVRTIAKEKKLTDAQLASGLNTVVEKYRGLKQPLFDWLKAHGVDKKFRLYVTNKAGQLGILQIPYNMKKKLETAVKEIESKDYPKRIAGDRKVNIKANGRWGVFFKFTRTGNASPTSDSVTVNMIEMGDEGACVPDFHMITDEVLEQAKEVLPCLIEMSEEIRLSDDKVEKLVQHIRDCDGSCDPDFVDGVMGKRVSGNKPAATQTPVTSVEDPFADSVSLPASKPAETVKAAVKPEVKAEVKPEAKPAPKAEPAAVVAPPAEPAGGADMSDDQFNSIFG
jgi:hypothetical protein